MTEKTEKKFDPKKPIETRDGRSARIIATDRKSTGNYPIVALVLSENGAYETAFNYQPNGRLLCQRESDLDLVNPVERKTVYMNVYPEVKVGSEAFTPVHGSLNAATEGASVRIGKKMAADTIELVFEDGVLVSSTVVGNRS